MKVQSARIPGEHAVQHERVHMKIQIEAPPKSLDHGHRTAATVRDAAVTRTGAQEAEHRADEQGDDPAAYVVIPRQLVPHAVGQTQDPLPHRHVGEHVIEQVGSSLSHSATATTWTQGSALAGKRGQPIEATVPAAKPREPTGKPATLQKTPKLLLHEAGQAFPVAQAGGLRAKGLEMILHDLVERNLPWISRFVGRRGRGHARSAGARRASEEPAEFGLNLSARAFEIVDFATAAFDSIAVLASPAQRDSSRGQCEMAACAFPRSRGRASPAK